MADETSQLLEEIRPVLFLAQATGIACFTFTPTTLGVSKQLKLYTSLLMVVMVPVTFLAFYLYIVVNKSLAAGIYRTVAILQIFCILAYNASVWINSLRNCGKIVEILAQLEEWDEISKLRLRRKSRFNSGVVVRVVLVLLSSFWYSKAVMVASTFFRLIFYCPLFLNTVFFHLVLVITEMIKGRFEILNATLVKGSLTTLKKTSFLHLKLSRIIARFNDAFGLHLLAMFAISFSNIIGGLYFSIAVLQSDHFTPADCFLMADSLFWSFNYAIDVWWLCRSCHATLEEAKRTGILVQMKWDCGKIDDKFMFALQMANEREEFNAAGFFPINYSLVYSIIGGVTTYLVIVLQFSGNKFEKVLF